MKPAALWPLALVAVLAITVVANIAVYVAASDPHGAAVESDYYRKAVAWDSTLAQQRASDALGWRADAAIAPLAPSGAGTIEVRLVDRAGAPIDGARAALEAIHNLEPEHPARATLAGRGDGRYAATLHWGHAGSWELRLTAVRGRARFLETLRREAAWASAR